MKRAQSGMTLIEVAVSIAVLGLMLVAAMTVYNAAENQRKTRVTLQRMDLVAKALSTYVESASRLPCPSDPASPDAPSGADAVLGWERGVPYNSTTVAAGTHPIGSCDDDREGVVPFLTLGIPASAAQDGWGNYFTYAVSPIFTQPTDRTGTGLTEMGDSIHNLCRDRTWVKNSDNANAPKARFCCAWSQAGINPPSSDIVMRLTTDGTATPLKNPRANATGANYGDIIAEYVNGSGVAIPAPMNQRSDIDVPAFVLISHGRNGFGAYLVDGTANRRLFTVGGGMNVNERNNADNDAGNVYFTGEISLGAGADYFDDIVLWRTQFGLMAYNGTSSCALP